MGNNTSSWRPQHNVLSQGSVLAPVLFNLYSNDLPVTRGRGCQFIWILDGQRLWHDCHPTYLGVTTPNAVLQRTLDKDCRQAEELKQLADEASRFHLGRQRQHSAVICSGILVTFCSHKSGRSAVELHHASRLWYPPFCASPMASDALQH